MVGWEETDEYLHTLLASGRLLKFNKIKNTFRAENYKIEFENQ